MSVVPMKFAQLVVHQNDVDTALQVVQSYSAFEVVANESDDSSSVVDTIAFPHANTLPRLQHVVNVLTEYVPQPSTLQSLLKGTLQARSQNVLQAELERVSEIEELVTEAETRHIHVSEAAETVRLFEEKLAFVEVWQDLPISFDELLTEHTTTFLVSRSALAGNESAGALAEQLSAALTENHITSAVHPVHEDAAAVTVYHSEEQQVGLEALVKTFDAEIVSAPTLAGTPAEAHAELTEELKAARAALETAEASLASFAAEHLNELRVSADVLEWQRERYAALEHAEMTAATVVLEGWVHGTRFPELEAGLVQSGVHYALSAREPTESEEPPVEIENHPLIRPFEVVTRLYGLPGHRDLDPTAFLAGFFFLFFGLSLTDVGYGIFLMIAALLLLFVLHVSKQVRLFGALLFMMGAASASVGLLFGGYLGIEPSSLPAFLQALQQFDPIGNPLPVFYLALGLGVVQIMFGMVLKIVSEAKNGRLLDGVLDQGPWLALFVAAIAYGASRTGYAFVGYADELLLLIYGAGIAIIVASGRKGDTIFQKVQSSLLSAYQSIGYFSDILSYSRLLALGLATTALAFAVNLIADIVRDAVPLLGGVLAIVVLVIGHAFTLAVNTLGAFIHSARLQFVEFFGKFISGTGRNFDPLTRRESYVTVVADDDT